MLLSSFECSVRLDL